MLSFTEFILEQAKAKSEIKDQYETISLIVFDHLLKTPSMKIKITLRNILEK